jgi:thiamine-phosphate pyrophosphorylase
VLALLDEEEGRPAVLLERLGQVVADVRRELSERSSPTDPPAPSADRLFLAARNWSVTFRADPQFTTDVFLIAVLRSDPNFERLAGTIGVDSTRLEEALVGSLPRPEEPVSEPATFALPAVDLDTGRVLDANFNRAREALRVLEDYCRFVMDDLLLTREMKALRHDLAGVSQQLPPSLLLAARDTPGDVGTGVSAGGEYHRGSAVEVAAVNLKRLQESLRSLEEYGKLIGPGLGRTLETLRYRAYTLERPVVLGSGARARLANARLYLLLSGSGASASLDWVIEQSAAGGVDVIQLREKSLSDHELIDRARNVRRWTRNAGVLFIMNDRPDIARLVEADGVHLGQDDLSVKEARYILGADALIGVSTHSVAQVRQAVLDGADYLGIGPIFSSTTKSFEELPGLALIRAATEKTSLPAFALGGIGPNNAAEVVAAGARRIAVSAAILRADDPGLAARLLRSVLPL